MPFGHSRFPVMVRPAPRGVQRPIAFKPNYNQQRAERNRSKEQKKQEKLQRRQSDAATRDDGEAPAPDTAEDSQDA